jgi:L-amino acid N-acyltransferase YncA
MYIIRLAEEPDFETLSQMEVTIAKITFGEEAVTDPAFHQKKIAASYQKSSEGMYVIAEENQVYGWLWMEKKENFVTKEKYINFRSFYIDEALRGSEYVDRLLQAGIEYAKKIHAEYIVGKVHTDNLPMRILYKKHGFQATHLTMEMKL